MRFKLTIEYAGTRYSGWQIQKNAKTVQGEIERAVNAATGERDFELYGSEPEEVARAMHDVKRLMRDYRSIRFGAQGRFHPEQAQALHREQLRWLESRLAEPFDGATVVGSISLVTTALRHPDAHIVVPDDQPRPSKIPPTHARPDAAKPTG